MKKPLWKRFFALTLIALLTGCSCFGPGRARLAQDVAQFPQWQALGVPAASIIVRSCRPDSQGVWRVLATVQGENAQLRAVRTYALSYRKKASEWTLLDISCAEGPSETTPVKGAPVRCAIQALFSLSGGSRYAAYPDQVSRIRLSPAVLDRQTCLSRQPAQDVFYFEIDYEYPLFEEHLSLPIRFTFYAPASGAPQWIPAVDDALILREFSLNKALLGPWQGDGLSLRVVALDRRGLTAQVLLKGHGREPLCFEGFFRLACGEHALLTPVNAPAWVPAFCLSGERLLCASDGGILAPVP